MKSERNDASNFFQKGCEIMSNQDIKQLIKSKRIFIYEIADVIGITEFSLHRWFRHDLTDEQRQKVLDAISTLEKARDSQ